MHSSCHLLLFLPLCLLLDSFLFILLLGFGLSKYSLCALYSHYTKGDRRGERTLCVCVCVRTVLLEMSTPIRCYCSVGKKKVSSSFLFFWPVRIGPARSVAQFGFPRLGFLHGICPTTFGCFREKSQHKCSREIVVMWSHAPPLWPNNFHLLRQKGKPSLYSHSSHLGDFLDSFLFFRYFPFGYLWVVVLFIWFSPVLPMRADNNTHTFSVSILPTNRRVDCYYDDPAIRWISDISTKWKDPTLSISAWISASSTCLSSGIFWKCRLSGT